MNSSLSLNTCSCHIINPHKTPILVWTRNNNNKVLVKIADQLFIGSSRTDKKGEKYWKCWNFLQEKNQTDSEQVNNSQTKQENN